MVRRNERLCGHATRGKSEALGAFERKKNAGFFSNDYSFHTQIPFSTMSLIAIGRNSNPSHSSFTFNLLPMCVCEISHDRKPVSNQKTRWKTQPAVRLLIAILSQPSFHHILSNSNLASHYHFFIAYFAFALPSPPSRIYLKLAGGMVYLKYLLSCFFALSCSIFIFCYTFWTNLTLFPTFILLISTPFRTLAGNSETGVRQEDSLENSEAGMKVRDTSFSSDMSRWKKFCLFCLPALNVSRGQRGTKGEEGRTWAGG